MSATEVASLLKSDPEVRVLDVERALSLATAVSLARFT